MGPGKLPVINHCWIVDEGKKILVIDLTPKRYNGLGLSNNTSSDVDYNVLNGNEKFRSSTTDQFPNLNL